MQEFRPGIYRHFKGGEYEALFLANDSENPEAQFVIYRSLEHGTLWARPLAMFMETVERDTYRGPRFAYLGPLKEDGRHD